MNTARSIIVGCSLIAANVLVHLGYSIHRDQVVTQQRRLELDHTRKVQADAYRATQSKAAWDAAIRGLDYDLQHWIESNAHLRNGEYIKLEFVSIKTFNFPDVQWLDDRHVRVNGYVQVSNVKTEQWFS
jgi:hypothetical protein